MLENPAFFLRSVLRILDRHPARLVPWAGCLVLAVLGGTAARAAPDDRILGAGHAALKFARLDFRGDAAAEWGLDQEGYPSLEVFGARDSAGRHYFGGEFGRVSADVFTDPQGDRLVDVSVWILEVNDKVVFDLSHHMRASVGGGVSLLYVSAEEEFEVDGATESSPLADFGFGLQLFAGMDWRLGRMLLGVEAKYHYAFDLLDLDYSNLRFGARIGVVF